MPWWEKQRDLYKEIPHDYQNEFSQALWAIDRVKVIEEIPDMYYLKGFFTHISDWHWHTIQIALGTAIYNKIARLKANNTY